GQLLPGAEVAVAGGDQRPAGLEDQGADLGRLVPRHEPAGTQVLQLDVVNLGDQAVQCPGGPDVFACDQHREIVLADGTQQVVFGPPQRQPGVLEVHRG